MSDYIQIKKTEQSKPMLYDNKNVVCPFCNFNNLKKERMVWEHPDKDILFVANKFPNLEGTKQNLIIESDSCEKDFTNYEISYIQKLLKYMIFCKNKLDEENFLRVLMFKNVGKEAGGSIPHHHIQLVGLRDIQGKIFTSADFDGIMIIENDEFCLTISQQPLTQHYEFNLISKIKDISLSFSQTLQQIVQFILTFHQKRYKSYNMIFEIINHRLMIKIIPRNVSDIYFIGYDIHLVPYDLQEVKQLFKQNYRIN